MKILKWLDRHFEETLLVAFLVGIAALMLAQIFMRRVLGQSLSWSEEVTRVFFIWSVFLSISLTLIRKSAMKLDVVFSLLPKPLRNPVTLLSIIVMLVFFVYMSGAAYRLVMTTKQSSATLGISMRWIYLSALLGFVLTIIRLVQLAIGKIRTFSRREDTNELAGDDYAG